MQAKLVTKIEANPLLSKQANENALLRVAAYCRVSTDSEDQIESYKAQVAHYTDAIAKNPRWRFVEIYADEAISGTQTKNRKAFMRMIRDCEKGKIDLILTKSIARFARNTVDSLKYVRKLKTQGIGVYFEEQNLDSLKADSEMFIGIHSVLAQAESENISANVRWGIQERMKSGTFKFRYNLLGYKKGEDGEPEIVPEEAEIIKKIYQMYLEGNSLDQIKKYLEEHHFLTKTQKSVWSKTLIKNILMNERYSGDMLLQKTYTENCITKKVKKNRGELAKYLIVNNHPAIIDRATFKEAQLEIARRGSKRKIADKTITAQGKYSGKFALSELLICGECGSPYRRRTWTNNGINRKVWRCLSRVEHGKQYCRESVTVDEEKLKAAICSGLSKAIENRGEVMSLILSNLSYAVTRKEECLDTYAIEQRIKELGERLKETVKWKAKTGGDTKRFETEIKNLSDELMTLREQLELTRKKMSTDIRIGTEIERVKKLLLSKEVHFQEYEDVVVRQLVEYIRVMKDDRIIMVLKGGLKIEGTIK